MSQPKSTKNEQEKTNSVTSKVVLATTGPIVWGLWKAIDAVTSSTKSNNPSSTPGSKKP